MKEVTITGFCDGEHGVKTLSTIERTLTVDGSKPVVLDLCDDCDQVILALLHLMDKGAALPVTKKGKTPKAVAAKPSRAGTGEDEKCPEKGCSHSSPNRAALGQHTRAQHGKGLKAYKNTDAVVDTAA